MTPIYDALKILFTDTLYLLDEIKKYKLYDCKRLIYKDNYFFGITEKQIQSHSLIDNKMLRVHFTIEKFPRELLPPKKYNPDALTKIKFNHTHGYLFKDKYFYIFSKNYNKLIKFPDISNRYHINFHTFINKQNEIINQQIIKRISKKILENKLPVDLTNLILAYL